MHIKIWKPVIGEMSGQKYLGVSAMLFCALCKTEQEAHTSFNPLALGGEQLVKTMTNNLSEIAECKCDTNQPLSQKQLAVFRDELQRLLTAGWLKDPATQGLS